MKKLYAIILAVCMMCSITAFAQPDLSVQTDVQTPQAEVTSDYIIVNFTMNPYRIKAGTIYFELYNSNDERVDYTSVSVDDTTNSFQIRLHAPEFNSSDTFYLKSSGALESISYASNSYGAHDNIPISFTEADGEITNNFSMTAYGNIQKLAFVYMNDTLQKFPTRMIDGTLMVHVDYASAALGIKDVTHNSKWNSVRVAVGNKDILFNIGTTYTTALGKDINSPVATQYIDGGVYVPLRLLCETFGSSIEVYDHYYYMDILITPSKDAIWFAKKNDKETYVNNQKLTSQTNYMVWVSKATYSVNVFEKKDGFWKLVNTFPCAIGTDKTPTCVGTYRYYERVERWTYPNYFVGPIMRFNGGYAIHTTLRNYDGTDYNPTVGKKLSLGCVRVQPDKMDWLINTIPMYSTIHVTNE